MARASAPYISGLFDYFRTAPTVRSDQQIDRYEFSLDLMNSNEETEHALSVGAVLVLCPGIAGDENVNHLSHDWI